MAKIDLLSKIEKIEAFEEKLQVKIENVSIRIDDDSLEIFYELYSTCNDTLVQDIDVNIVLYGQDGSILCNESTYFECDKFMGFIVGGEYLDVKPNKISKIKIYPTMG